MSEQTILNLRTELDTLAANIEATQNNLAETLEAISEADEQLETMKAAHLADVLNARFEINHKLKFTNDDQRKTETVARINGDANFIAMQTARKTLIATQAAQKAEIEKNRNLHKSRILVLQFYANSPAS